MYPGTSMKKVRVRAIFVKVSDAGIEGDSFERIIQAYADTIPEARNRIPKMIADIEKKERAKLKTQRLVLDPKGRQHNLGRR